MKTSNSKTKAFAFWEAAFVLLIALMFTACPNSAGGSDSGSGGGNTPPLPKHAVNFSVDGGNGTIKATVGGSKISSGDEVEQGKIVEFTATADNPATHDVDYWMISTGSFEAGTGGSGSTSAKVKVVQPVNVTVRFKSLGALPTPMHTVSFGVNGTGGTLKAEVDGTEITSPAQVGENKTIVFTARPENAGYVVEKWTNGGSPIAGETTTVYTHTVTADADIAVHFKTVTAYDIYVSVTSNYKAYVYKNGSPTALSAQSPANYLNCSTVKALGTQVYIAGDELEYGAAKPRVWKADGSRHWSGTNGWSSASDMVLHNGKTLVAGKTYDGTDDGASITDISDPAHPAVTFLYKKTSSESAEAQALCSENGKVYAAGYKQNGSTKKAFLWMLPDGGTVNEVELGIMQASAYDTGQSIAGVCIQGGSVYVAGKKLWKVDGTTVTEINVPDAAIITAVCAHGTAVYATGKNMNADPTVWKIERASASLYTTFSTNNSNSYALCAFGSTLFAAGTIYDGGLYKPAWWSIADDLTITEHKLGTASGAAYGICVTPQ